MANDFNKFISMLKEIKTKVKKELTKSNLPETIGKESAEMVKTRTRNGFGVDKNEGKKRRLKTLAKSTKNIRKTLKSLGTLSSETTPNKTNFTRTGKTLDNLKVTTSDGKVNVSVDSHGKQAVEQTSKISEKFNFMALSKSETKVIKKTIESELRNVLKKYL